MESRDRRWGTFGLGERDGFLLDKLLRRPLQIISRVVQSSIEQRHKLLKLSLGRTGAPYKLRSFVRSKIINIFGVNILQFFFFQDRGRRFESVMFFAIGALGHCGAGDG